MTGLIQYIGDYLGEDTRYGQIPDEPNNVVMLNYKSGISPTYVMGQDISDRRRPFVQVITRNEDYFEGMNRANEVRELLEALHGTHSDYFIVSVIATSEILEQGRDDKNRYSFLDNYIVNVVGGK